MSEGKEISTGEQVEERLQAGATVTTTVDPFFLKKGPFAIYDIKKELVDLRKASIDKEWDWERAVFSYLRKIMFIIR